MLFKRKSLQSLQRLCETIGPFDLVIDDASHHAKDIIANFKAIFPYMRSGSIYVMEDLQTQYLKPWGGYGTYGNPMDGAGTATRFLKDLADHLNYRAAVTGHDTGELAEQQEILRSHYSRRIDSIHFYAAIAFVFFK